MLSAPPASAKSASPSASACTQETIACAPEPQSRLTFIAGARVRHAGLDRGDAAEVHVARLGVDDVAEDHVADLAALDAGARQRLARGGGGERDRRDRGEAAAEGADRGARAVENHDVARSCRSPPPQSPRREPLGCAGCKRRAAARIGKKPPRRRLRRIAALSTGADSAYTALACDSGRRRRAGSDRRSTIAISRASGRGFLARQGVTCTLAGTAAEAYAALRGGGFEALVLDMELPKGEAIAVADFATYRNPDLPIIAVTARGFFSDGAIFELVPNARGAAARAAPARGHGGADRALRRRAAAAQREAALGRLTSGRRRARPCGCRQSIAGPTGTIRSG